MRPTRRPRQHVNSFRIKFYISLGPRLRIDRHPSRSPCYYIAMEEHILKGNCILSGRGNEGKLNHSRVHNRSLPEICQCTLLMFYSFWHWSEPLYFPTRLDRLVVVDITEISSTYHLPPPLFLRFTSLSELLLICSLCSSQISSLSS